VAGAVRLGRPRLFVGALALAAVFLGLPTLPLGLPTLPLGFPTFFLGAAFFGLPAFPLGLPAFFLGFAAAFFLVFFGAVLLVPRNFSILQDFFLSESFYRFPSLL
jgi:hypothetical protein